MQVIDTHLEGEVSIVDVKESIWVHRCLSKFCTHSCSRACAWTRVCVVMYLRWRATVSMRSELCLRVTSKGGQHAQPALTVVTVRRRLAHWRAMVCPQDPRGHERLDNLREHGQSLKGPR